MPPPDHYATLGVAETASAEEIKKTYRRLARENHPDRNPGDKKAEERFKEVQQAYDVLGDAERRAAYDRQRRNPFGADFGESAGASGSGRFYRTPDGTYVRVDPTGFGPDGGYSFSDEGTGGLGDLFERFFGGQARGGRGPAGGFGGFEPPPQPAGGDVESELALSFEDALRGGKREVSLPNGETVRITIPAGVEDSTRVRLRGLGQAGPTGKRGDLYLTYRVAPSPRVQREGLDLVVSEPISMVEAVAGTERTITSPLGSRLRLRVPPGTQPGSRLRMRGQGVKTNGATGDLYVEIRVRIPDELPPEAVEALRAWEAEFANR